jgi:hypothetical protein
MSTIDERTPDRLIVMFSKSRLMLGLAAAVIIHILIIGATSMGYIRDTVIDPEGAEARRAERQVAPATPAPPRPAPPPATPAAVPAPDSASSTPAPGSNEALMEERKDTPMVKAVTEAAKPEEIPALPEIRGLSLEDTNPGR